MWRARNLDVTRRLRSKPKWLRALLLTIGAYVSTLCLSDAAQHLKDIAPDESIQRLIKDEAEFRLRNTNDLTRNHVKERPVSPIYGELRKLSVKDPEMFAQQLSYYMYTGEEKRGHPPVSFGLSLLKELVDPKARVSAVAPFTKDYIEAVADRIDLYPKSRNTMPYLLDDLWKRRDGSRDFSAFKAYLASAKPDGEKPQVGIIYYILMSDPGAGLKILNEIYGTGVLSRSDRRRIEADADSITYWLSPNRVKRILPTASRLAIPKVRRILDRFSRNENWWVRLYAAEILQSGVEEIQDQSVRERLQQDKDPIVANWIKRPAGR